MKKETDEKIAIVGMSAWYPGAKNLLELWENVLSTRVQFREIPKARLPLDEYYNADPTAFDKTYANRVAAIDGYEFDWVNKRIPKQTYEATDPVQWLALDMTIKMFEDANINIETLPKETTGVILGNTMVGDVTRPKYFRARWPFIRKSLRVTAEKSGMQASDILKLETSMEGVFKSVFVTTTEDTMAGELSNTIAGRISNYFNLNGGGHTVDGACSSSLIAIITASDRLLAGDLDFAITGGVDLSLDTFELIGFSKMGALSKTEMRVYDQRGDGFIAGEGCGIIGLKRLSDAKRDGNKVYATLEGWGISSDGKGGIATPTIDGQILALTRAYNKANINPCELDFIEGHGTGTKVGDYIEIHNRAY
jgi:acyl transferase domain-containing protein